MNGERVRAVADGGNPECVGKGIEPDREAAQTVGRCRSAASRSRYDRPGNRRVRLAGQNGPAHRHLTVHDRSGYDEDSRGQAGKTTVVSHSHTMTFSVFAAAP